MKFTSVAIQVILPYPFPFCYQTSSSSIASVIVSTCIYLTSRANPYSLGQCLSPVFFTLPFSPFLTHPVVASPHLRRFAPITFSVSRLRHYPWFSSHTLLIHTLLPLHCPHPPSRILLPILTLLPPSISPCLLCPSFAFSLPPFSSDLVSHAIWSYTSSFSSVSRRSISSSGSPPLALLHYRQRQNKPPPTEGMNENRLVEATIGRTRVQEARGSGETHVVGASIVTVLNERPWQSVSFPAAETRGTQQFYQFISIPVEAWPTRTQGPFCFLNATRSHRRRVPRDRERGHLLLLEPDVLLRTPLFAGLNFKDKESRLIKRSLVHYRNSRTVYWQH